MKRPVISIDGVYVGQARGIRHAQEILAETLSEIIGQNYDYIELVNIENRKRDKGEPIPVDNLFYVAMENTQ